VQLLNRLTDRQIIGDSNDAEHQLTCGDSFIRMSGNGFEIVCDQHSMPYGGFSQQWLVFHALHCRFLDDHIIQRWNTQPQPAQDALVKVFINEQAQHGSV